MFNPFPIWPILFSPFSIIKNKIKINSSLIYNLHPFKPAYLQILLTSPLQEREQREVKKRKKKKPKKEIDLSDLFLQSFQSTFSCFNFFSFFFVGIFIIISCFQLLLLFCDDIKYVCYLRSNSLTEFQLLLIPRCLNVTQKQKSQHLNSLFVCPEHKACINNTTRPVFFSQSHAISFINQQLPPYFSYT